jgi:hypothetical protein
MAAHGRAAAKGGGGDQGGDCGGDEAQAQELVSQPSPLEEYADM